MRAGWGWAGRNQGPGRAYRRPLLFLQLREWGCYREVNPLETRTGKKSGRSTAPRD